MKHVVRNACKEMFKINQSAEGTTEYSRKDAKERKVSVTELRQCIPKVCRLLSVVRCLLTFLQLLIEFQ